MLPPAAVYRTPKATLRSAEIRVNAKDWELLSLLCHCGPESSLQLSEVHNTFTYFYSVAIISTSKTVDLAMSLSKGILIRENKQRATDNNVWPPYSLYLNESWPNSRRFLCFIASHLLNQWRIRLLNVHSVHNSCKRLTQLLDCRLNRIYAFQSLHIIVSLFAFNTTKSFAYTSWRSKSTSRTHRKGL